MKNSLTRQPSKTVRSLTRHFQDEASGEVVERDRHILALHTFKQLPQDVAGVSELSFSERLYVGERYRKNLTRRTKLQFRDNATVDSPYYMLRVLAHKAFYHVVGLEAIRRWDYYNELLEADARPTLEVGTQPDGLYLPGYPGWNYSVRQMVPTIEAQTAVIETKDNPSLTLWAREVGIQSLHVTDMQMVYENRWLRSVLSTRDPVQVPIGPRERLSPFLADPWSM